MHETFVNNFVTRYIGTNKYYVLILQTIRGKAMLVEHSSPSLVHMYKHSFYNHRYTYISFACIYYHLTGRHCY